MLYLIWRSKYLGTIFIESIAKTREAEERAFTCDKFSRPRYSTKFQEYRTIDSINFWVKIQVRNLKSFLVCTTYRPPGTPTTSLDTDLGASLISASLLNKQIYILGDMNCNLLQPELVDSQAFVNLCRTYNSNQMVTEHV